MNDSKTIEQIIKDMEKLQERYRKKAEKEREKRRKPYITVQGQKVYSQEELFDFWESGYITSSARFDQYRDKLQAVLKPAEEQTPSEAMLEMLEKIIKGLHTEKSFMEEEQEA